MPNLNKVGRAACCPIIPPSSLTKGRLRLPLFLKATFRGLCPFCKRDIWGFGCWKTLVRNQLDLLVRITLLDFAVYDRCRSKVWCSSDHFCS